MKLHQINDKRTKRILSLNSSTDDLFFVEQDKTINRRVVIDGESFSRYEFIRIIKSGNACCCGQCFDCAVADEATRCDI